MIYAIDFDGTLCVNAYPDIGLGIYHAIKNVRELKRLGHTIIINTCRVGKEADAAKAWLEWWRVPYDHFNENAPERIAEFGGDARKISADRYIDDRGFVGEIPWAEFMEEARNTAGEYADRGHGCWDCGHRTWDIWHRKWACHHFSAFRANQESYTEENCPHDAGWTSGFTYQPDVAAAKDHADAPNAAIPGVGPDAPTTTNAKGGKQSATPYRLDLLDAKALLEQGEILGKGAAKYGEYNWKNLTIDELLNHAVVHILAWRAGDRQDNHLGHSVCRLLMARTLEMEEGKANERGA